jgi:hypothetical protein
MPDNESVARQRPNQILTLRYAITCLETIQKIQKPSGSKMATPLGTILEQQRQAVEISPKV